MLIHDDIFSWKGFGGLLELASGRCRLRIFELPKAKDGNVMLLRPQVVVVSDLPAEGSPLKKVSVRSCTSHIATSVSQEFHINPHRMLYLEYQPASFYGENNQHCIPAKLDIVDFIWHDHKALHPKWRPLEKPLLDKVMEMIQATEP